MTETSYQQQANHDRHNDSDDQHGKAWIGASARPLVRTTVTLHVVPAQSRRRAI